MGRKLISSSTVHVEDIKVNKNLILDIDSEYLLKEDSTQYAKPIRAIFDDNGSKVKTTILEHIKQCNDEVETAQVTQVYNRAIRVRMEPLISRSEKGILVVSLYGNQND